MFGQEKIEVTFLPSRSQLPLLVTLLLHPFTHWLQSFESYTDGPYPYRRWVRGSPFLWT